MRYEYEIDASNQSLGRIASRSAYILRGKDSVAYRPEKIPSSKVIIKNLGKVKFTGNKFEQKSYYRHSGYHGGLKEKKLSELWESKPKEVVRQMVYHMLPKNKLRDKIIKNLKFK